MKSPLGRAVLLLPLLLTAVVACKRRGVDWRIEQLYASETSADVVRRPAKVQAFRVRPDAGEFAPGDVHAGPFVASGSAVDVPPETAAELSAVFFDAGSFDWAGSPPRGVLRPQVGLWFMKGGRVLEIALDLETDQVGVFAGDQPLGHWSIDPARDRLSAAMKRVFVDDAAVQSLR
jgi:hypothetical protein